jgi:transposase
VDHGILKIAYHVLTKQQTYQDLGEKYFDERDREAVKRRAVRRLEQLGFSVNLSPTQATA